MFTPAAIGPGRGLAVFTHADIGNHVHAVVTGGTEGIGDKPPDPLKGE